DPQNLASVVPDALRLVEGNSDASSSEVLEVEARFRRCADTFLRSRFGEAFLENIARNEPLAPATIEGNPQDQTATVAAQSHFVDSAQRSLLQRVADLRKKAREVEEKSIRVDERLGSIACRASAKHTPTEEGKKKEVSPLLSTPIHTLAKENTARDREQEETLSRQAKEMVELEARLKIRQADVSKLRESVQQTRARLETLERERDETRGGGGEGGVVAAATEARLATARAQEATVGVEGLSEDDIEDAIEEEEKQLRQHKDMWELYQSTLAALEMISGIRVECKSATDAGASPRKGGNVSSEEGARLLFLVYLSGEYVMEVRLDAKDGSLRSVHLFFDRVDGERSDAPAEDVQKEVDIYDLAQTADRLPSPENLQYLVREAVSRLECMCLRTEHLKLLKKQYLVCYVAPLREVTITMTEGIVASFGLSPDYPK
ncbi:unnamed protein product, partial [Choristocarpus tenellus]